MALILPDFEYDIFSSYRQNDNAYDGWVTEPVDNLNKELDATLKNKVNVYFDANPPDFRCMPVESLFPNRESLFRESTLYAKRLAGMTNTWVASSANNVSLLFTEAAVEVHRVPLKPV